MLSYKASVDVVDEELNPTLFLESLPTANLYYPAPRFRFRDAPFKPDPLSIDDLPLPEISEAPEEPSYSLPSTELKALPTSDRPRERLARIGPEALSTIELLAILLGSGTKNCSVLQLAAQLMARFGSLSALSDASLRELSSLKGIGFAKAVQLKAAFTLHDRLPLRPIEKVRFDKASKIYDLVGSELKKEKVEVIMVILLDARKRLIHREIAGKGILDQILVHPREIFHLAIRHRAHSIVIAHNHPSGDPAPSQQDLEMTHILQKSGQILGIQLTDHLIVAGETYVSFAESNLFRCSESL